MEIFHLKMSALRPRASNESVFFHFPDLLSFRREEVGLVAIVLFEAHRENVSGDAGAILPQDENAGCRIENTLIILEPAAEHECVHSWTPFPMISGEKQR